MQPDFCQEVAAHGVVSGFGLHIEGSRISSPGGLAYCYGDRLSGEWEVDLAGQPEGWWSIGLSPEGVVAGLGKIASGLPLCVALTDARGTVLVLRDIRRYCQVFLWEHISRSAVAIFEPRGTFRLARVQAAAREKVTHADEVGWGICLVGLPVPVGSLVRGPVVWPLQFEKRGDRGAGITIEGYQF